MSGSIALDATCDLRHCDDCDDCDCDLNNCDCDCDLDDLDLDCNNHNCKYVNPCCERNNYDILCVPFRGSYSGCTSSWRGLFRGRRSTGPAN